MGSSGLINPSFKPFDFASNDVLCSYDDFNQENDSTKLISDLETGKDFSKDFQRSRIMTRCSSGVANNQLDDALCQATLNLVEKCMKRHSDDILRVLQGISSRLSHLELYCYNVDKSVGEIHLNLRRDYEETDARLASLDRHLEEVSRSVQILRDKQELAENQKELSSPNALRHNAARSDSPSTDYQKNDDTFELQNQHLAIVLHNQVPPQQQSSPTRPVELRQPIVPSSQAAPQHTAQHQQYYLTPAPYHVQIQPSQSQYLTSGTLYHTPQSLQPDMNCVQFQQVPAQAQVHHFIQHPQQTQQPQQMISAQVSAQQLPLPAPSRPQSASGYPPHGPNQSFFRVAQEAAPTTIPMNSSFPSTPQQVLTCANGYSGGPMQLQPPSQHINENSVAAYGSVGPHQSLCPANTTTYLMYSNEDGKSQSHFPQGTHPPTAQPRQHMQHVSIVHNTRNSTQNELVGKLVNSGFRADRVVPVIQTMEQNREVINYNSVLNKLNIQSSGHHRGWTGQ